MTLLLLVFAECTWANASSSQSTDFAFVQIVTALGYPEATTPELIQNRLNQAWVGKSREDMQACLSKVIQNRGLLGAFKNTKATVLTLSSKDIMLRVDISYDNSDQASRIVCTLKHSSTKNPRRKPAKILAP